MKTETKERVLNFLKKNPDHEFSIRQLHKAVKISYPSAQRVVAILHAEGKIKIKDLGNTKLVRVI